MAVSSDKLVGSGLLLVSVTIFVYYTLWVIVLPFVDTSHPVQDFFLPRKYAIAIPTVLVILLVTLVATFIGLTLMKSARKQKLKSS
ncbi:unnamed protein product [Ectocarpus sp. 6 AP-2014]|uniref:Dolichol phosphate-mannose biosynthesis regulatory protein n=1 Tax=Ectocarpus siliculosus TaxID=2880 RepID=D8LM32_ECTSI|nr:conserved unknown protein [Ectocarpus siliculosus]|eukprot:CBN77246.1 conserved unknown protein [Ectocarpus siliculosus]